MNLSPFLSQFKIKRTQNSSLKLEYDERLDFNISKNSPQYLTVIPNTQINTELSNDNDDLEVKIKTGYLLKSRKKIEANSEKKNDLSLATFTKVNGETADKISDMILFTATGTRVNGEQLDSCC